ncbi:hypothetical protein RSSM_04960 [Rhodopirellula sallentina SM41]|uniref:Uncharacterized protein n=1 Tax=Rhodopirellula sallentina SM41 TaxID=1263870 RepID=M5TWR9_9BACT|nr:hypothetical protein RSSM_04960 [Rhodopirellula sallentina SM41]
MIVVFQMGKCFLAMWREPKVLSPIRKLFSMDAPAALAAVASYQPWRTPNG